MNSQQPADDIQLQSHTADVRRIAGALKAAAALLPIRHPSTARVERKAGGDPVTDAERAVDRLLREMLPAPGEGWLSEETKDNPGRLANRRVWVVDPLDGTREYVTGIPEWCISIGLIEDGSPVAGGIYNPATEEMFVGSVTSGLAVNACVLASQKTRDMDEVIVLASRSEFDRGEWGYAREAPFTVRPMGSVAYKLALVAAGLADATWTGVPKHEWDVAAGVALVLAARGAVCTLEGAPPVFNRAHPLFNGLIAASRVGQSRLSPQLASSASDSEWTDYLRKCCTATTQGLQGSSRQDSSTMKIVNIVGARPNLVKIAPLMREMGRHPEIEPILVHTGQHYDEKLSTVFFRQMGIPKPDVNLEVGSGSHGWQTAEVLRRMEQLLMEQRPDLLLVVGDVNSTMAATLAAAKLGIPVAHVEAGLRSFDRAMPEEINRIVTDALADHLFVTEADGVANLLREGRSPDCIHLVGNVMIDALRQFLPIAQQSQIATELGFADGNGVHPYAVLTLHRPSNVDSVETLRELLRAVEAAADMLPVLFPVHPRTQQKLAALPGTMHPQIRMVPPVGYLDFLCLLSRATLVLTDSGGIQEETTALGVPCLTMRENTERPVTVTEGTNRIVGTDPEKIIAAIRETLGGGGKAGRVPEFWDGHAAQRIVDILLRQPAGAAVSA